MRDLNNNGLSELALRWSTGDGCCALERLTLLEFSQAGWEALGELPVSFNFEQLSTNFYDYQYKLFVQKGPRPIFVGVDLTHQNIPSVLELSEAQLELRNF